MRVENLHIKESAIKAGAPQTVSFDVQSSVIISSGGITRENFSIERLKIWLYLDIVANVIQSVVKGTDFLIYEAITAGGYNIGNNQIILAKYNNNELNEEFPKLYENFNTLTVIIEASNYYYNSVQFLVWVFIDNITEI